MKYCWLHTFCWHQFPSSSSLYIMLTCHCCHPTHLLYAPHSGWSATYIPRYIESVGYRWGHTCTCTHTYTHAHTHTQISIYTIHTHTCMHHTMCVCNVHISVHAHRCVQHAGVLAGDSNACIFIHTYTHIHQTWFNVWSSGDWKCQQRSIPLPSHSLHKAWVTNSFTLVSQG